MDTVIVLAAVEPICVVVPELVVVGVGGVVVVVDWHGLASFSTSHDKWQYAVKHQPAPSVLLYMRLPI